MAYNLNPDFSKTGVAVISDSGDIPVNVGSTVVGLNGLIQYKKNYYKREVTVELRSEASKNAFVSGIDSLEISYDGHCYYLRNATLVEQFSGGTKGVWTYSIEMIRGTNAVSCDS